MPARRWPWWAEVVAAAVLAVLVTVGLRLLVVQAFVIPTASMQPLLQPGDRVAVLRLPALTGDVQRGDVVVFDGRGTFPDGGDYAKRVVGVAGDRVACCAADGRLTVNGAPLEEPYLYPGDRPSDLRFDVVVPQGRLWVLGDHRSVSADSRSLLGRPGGGMVRQDRVTGRVVAVLWPVDRIGIVERTP
ncbi:signal peptidase I [Quadrisphaera sp. GCM10027208]|uniref:signal peptidase I n=1 Tax=Quadrisphaera sp. GCM10027208 TaxID=3273423 RepID=UPI00360645DA